MTRRAPVSSLARTLLLASLLLANAAAQVCSAEDPALTIIGRHGKTKPLSAEELKQLPRMNVEAVERDGSTATYSGVEIAELLGQVQTAQGETLRSDWMRCVVIIEAADGYRTVFALPEFDSSFTDRKIILADTRNGSPLDAKHGPLQIIVPHEKRYSRWVRMVQKITVIDSNVLEQAR